MLYLKLQNRRKTNLFAVYIIIGDKLTMYRPIRILPKTVIPAWENMLVYWLISLEASGWSVITLMLPQ